MAILATAAAIAIAGCARSADDYIARGDASLEAGNVAAAVLEYRNAVEKDPLLAPARLKLADAFLRQGNGAGALGEFVRAADLLPNDVDAQLKAGSMLLIAGHWGDAKDRADKALSIDPQDVNALVLRANALAGLTDLDGALEQMQQAVALDPRSSLQTNLGAIRAARGDLPEAEAAFRQAVTTDPMSADAQVALGQFLWSAGKAADAESAFKAALTIDAAHQQANRALALFYLQGGRASEAEPHFKKVVEVAGAVDATLALADYYMGMSRPADAVALLEKLSADAGQWGLARAKIAEIQHAQGKAPEAFRSLDEVIAREPALVPARLVRGRLLLADGRIDEALQDAQAALALAPRNAEVHYLLGTTHEAKRDLGAAAASFAEVLRLNPRAAPAQVRLAMVEMQRNALPAATQLAEQAVAAQPGNTTAQIVLARGLIARGDLDRATAITEGLVKAAPNVAVVQNQAGMLALARGDRTGARAAFEKALSLNEVMVEPLLALVTLDLDENQTARARARVEQRLLKTPNSSVVLALAGRTWAATGDLVKGEELLRRAIEADPSNFEAYSELARVYVAGRKPDDAVAELDKLAARQPNAVGPQTMAAVILQGQGKDVEAQRRYERLVERDPRAAVASNNLAWMYASRGEQLDRALQLAQAAKAEIPDHAEVNDTLAFVYLKKQLPALAIPPLKLAVEKAPDNPAFHYHLGLAYVQTGDKAAAREALGQALRLNSNFADAEEARKLLNTLG